jgi:hypothetical protein
MKHAWERIERCTGLWWGSLQERPLGRPMSRCEDEIKMDLRETGWGVNSI